MAQASGVSVKAWELGIQAVECITLAQASGVLVTAWELGIQTVGCITLAQASSVLDTARELGIQAVECITLAQASGVLVEACRMARHDVAGGARTNKARRFAKDKAEVSADGVGSAFGGSIDRGRRRRASARSKRRPVAIGFVTEAERGRPAVAGV